MEQVLAVAAWIDDRITVLQLLYLFRAALCSGPRVECKA